MKTSIRIIHGQGRYSIEFEDGKLYVLNENSLKWNLKNVFGLSGEDVVSLMVGLQLTNVMVVDLEKVG